MSRSDVLDAAKLKTMMQEREGESIMRTPQVGKICLVGVGLQEHCKATGTVSVNQLQPRIKRTAIGFSVHQLDCMRII